MRNKFDRLTRILAEMGSAVIAYSGGVDSTFLLKAACLSGMRTLAVTGYSPTMPEDDLEEARRIAGIICVPHMVIETDELGVDSFVKNPVDRCFYCKDELFGKLKDIAVLEGYGFVLDGSNLDDLGDWRPGRRAASKHGVRSPLSEAGLTKEEIRTLSFELGLQTWDKPASPCLSSRFPYGEPISFEALRRVDAAEKFLRTFGFREFRVRHFGETAKIELKEEDIHIMLEPTVRNAITEKLKELGYKFVTLDLEGFRSGKLNITQKKTG